MDRSDLSPRQRGALWLRLAIRGLAALTILAFLSRFGPRLLELTTPFLLALVAAVLLDPLVRRIQSWTGTTRRFSALVLVLGLVLFAGGGVSALLYYGGRELMDLVTNWEGLYIGFQRAVGSIEWAFVSLFSLIPPELSAAADVAVEQLLGWLEELIPRTLGDLGAQTREKFMGLPAFLVALLMFLMGTYFLTVDYPAICKRVSNGMTDRFCRALSQARSAALIAFGGYLKAQLLLSFGVFCILLLSFLVTGQSYSLLLAFGLAVLDFIPLLGAGTVMVPWAVFALLTHAYPTAIAVAVIWGVIALYRRAAEPKVVGDQTGLSPTLSLFSIYLGMKLGGIVGMILGPVAVLVLLNLGRSGLFRGVWRDVRDAVLDLAAILSAREE